MSVIMSFLKNIVNPQSQPVQDLGQALNKQFGRLITREVAYTRGSEKVSETKILSEMVEEKLSIKSPTAALSEKQRDITEWNNKSTDPSFAPMAKQLIPFVQEQADRINELVRFSKDNKSLIQQVQRLKQTDQKQYFSELNKLDQPTRILIESCLLDSNSNNNNNNVTTTRMNAVSQHQSSAKSKIEELAQKFKNTKISSNEVNLALGTYVNIPEHITFSIDQENGSLSNLITTIMKIVNKLNNSANKTESQIAIATECLSKLNILKKLNIFTQENEELINQAINELNSDDADLSNIDTNAILLISQLSKVVTERKEEDVVEGRQERNAATNPVSTTILGQINQTRNADAMQAERVFDSITEL